ncbi:unnamed protein product [Paramecium sonneborni]|uniref:Uncharacterized protein n=1 Tax=Paramecium sonneborni TaxID=65129 RepID=A0A8S1RNF6_9CILI|nr:unnamed protein product [Paramecium sonneborni]
MILQLYYCFSNYWTEYTKIVVEQFENQLIRIGSQKEMSFDKRAQYVQNSIIALTLKMLQNNIIGMAINIQFKFTQFQLE